VRIVATGRTTAGLAGVLALPVAGLISLALLRHEPSAPQHLHVWPAPPVIETPSGGGDVGSMIFLHHSVGSNLIDDGNLRGLLTERGYAFYDQGYNEQGLTLPDGEPSGYGYAIPDDNTDPDGLAAIFSETVDARSVAETGAPVNTVSGLMRHDVIMFKSCFPVNGIASDAQLEAYKRYYRTIRSFADEHDDHLFIALSPPPLEPSSTNPSEAARARAFADWLTSSEFTGHGHSLVVIDLFDLLAEFDTSRADHNMLRADYRPGADSYRPKALAKRLLNLGFETVGSARRFGGGDSHPNARASQLVAPLLADAVDRAVRAYSHTRQKTADAAHSPPVHAR
jgi:hypothetical protein